MKKRYYYVMHVICTYLSIMRTGGKVWPRLSWHAGRYKSLYKGISKEFYKELYKS